ncbi:MAG: amidohydrolase family protein [Sphingobium sp.]|nr:amidohydrolase family protein [Sphingobium sp.]
MACRRRDALRSIAGACVAAVSMNSAAAAAARTTIDVHAHLAVPSYLDLLATAGLRPGGYAGAGAGAARSPTSGGAGGDDAAAIAARLKLMDDAGVGRQILSPSLAPYLPDQAVAGQAARILNERHARLMADVPGRFGAFACLPLPHIDASLAELRHGLDTLGLTGISMQASCLGTSIADERFAPLFAEMNRRRAVLFVHPAVNGLHSPLIADWRLDTSIGPLLEDVAIATQLIAANIPARYPDLKIVVPHLGGGLATMLDRLDNQLPLAVPGLAGRPSDMARRLWYDSVSHGSLAALDAAVAAFGADRIVPGSDYPVLLAFEPYARTIGYVHGASAAGAPTKILHDNAGKLFAGTHF